jgi:signal transduction histidine kinase
LKEQWRLDAACVTHPLLFECDREGRVVWMSNHARAVLGDRPLHAAIAEYLSIGVSFRLWPAFVMPETLLFAAQAEGPREAASDGFGEDLLGHYFRLEKAERKLADATRLARAGRRAPALHQVERERQRLGRELHTGVGQLLAAIRLQLEAIAAQMPSPAESVQQALGRIDWLSQEALQQVRGISRRLYPPEWQKLSIEEALRQLWEVSGIEQRLDGRLNIERLPREPAHEIKVLIYRTAQEGISNISRHSMASHAQMTLETKNDRIVLTMHDDGCGFDPGPQGADGGLGLRSMRDAASEAGAEFEVESVSGSTTLRVCAPFETE